MVASPIAPAPPPLYEVVASALLHSFRESAVFTGHPPPCGLSVPVFMASLQDLGSDGHALPALSNGGVTAASYEAASCVANMAVHTSERV